MNNTTMVIFGSIGFILGAVLLIMLISTLYGVANWVFLKIMDWFD